MKNFLWASLFLVLGLFGCNEKPTQVQPVPVPPQTYPDPVPPMPAPAPVLTGTMTKVDLNMGLNTYPGAPLRGCVNDALDMADLAKGEGFTDIRLLLNEDATTARMLAAIKKAAWETPPPAIVLVTYSGHGADWTGPGSETEADGTTEVLCPIDFDWTPEHMITDDQLYDIFSKAPEGVAIWFLSDSCHSGDLIREVNPKKISKSYPLIPPSMRARNKAGLQKNTGKKAELMIGYGSGCKSNELSADTSDDSGRPCGAFTLYFKQVYKQSGKSKVFSALIADENKLLSLTGYDQHPQAEGLRRNSIFLSWDIPKTGIKWKWAKVPVK